MTSAEHVASPVEIAIRDEFDSWVDHFCKFSHPVVYMRGVFTAQLVICIRLGLHSLADDISRHVDSLRKGGAA